MKKIIIILGTHHGKWPVTKKAIAEMNEALSSEFFHFPQKMVASKRLVATAYKPWK